MIRVNGQQEARGKRMKDEKAKKKIKRYGKNNSQEAKLEQEQRNVHIPCYSHH